VTIGVALAISALSEEFQMAGSDVVIYTTMFCPYCQRAKSLLDEKGIAFQEIPVDGDRAGRQAMTQRAGGRTSVPQIFFGDRHIGGCDDLMALEQSGKLDALRGEAAR
jgi:glutaredoxin 3